MGSIPYTVVTDWERRPFALLTTESSPGDTSRQCGSALIAAQKRTRALQEAYDALHVQRWRLCPGYVNTGGGAGYPVWHAYDLDAQRYVGDSFDSEQDVIDMMRRRCPQAVRCINTDDGWVAR